MSEIIVAQDSKLIKVLAADARHERLDSNVRAEADDIIRELANDASPMARHQLAQTVAFTVNDLQQGALDFLSSVADIRTINYGDKAAFKTRRGNVKAYMQAKGATTSRSMVTANQILVGTNEIAVRPAISLIDIKAQRVAMGDLVREANTAMTNEKIKAVEKTLLTGIGSYASPFYTTGSTLNQTNLDAQINHFRRLGPVTLLGDMSAVSQLAPLSGMAMSSTQNQFSNGQIDEFAQYGIIGRYKGCAVVAMPNAYEADGVTPILSTDKIYIIVGGLTADEKNLKLVNEGTVSSVESNNIDDRVEEILLYQWFGSAFVVGTVPTIGVLDM